MKSLSSENCSSSLPHPGSTEPSGTEIHKPLPCCLALFSLTTDRLMEGELSDPDN